MKECKNCQSQLNDEAAFCTVCGMPAEQNTAAAQPTVPPTQAVNSVNAPPNNPYASQQPPYQVVQPADNRRTYSIMSYIGVLWLFGLCSAPEKFDPRVRFNVGQGIIASIVSAACSIIGWILTAIITALGTSSTTLYGYTLYTEVSPVVSVLNGIIWAAVSGISIFYMVYGIVKVTKNQDTYLPLIGKFAFYK